MLASLMVSSFEEAIVAKFLTLATLVSSTKLEYGSWTAPDFEYSRFGDRFLGNPSHFFSMLVIFACMSSIFDIGNLYIEIGHMSLGSNICSRIHALHLPGSISLSIFVNDFTSSLHTSPICSLSWQVLLYILPKYFIGFSVIDFTASPL